MATGDRARLLKELQESSIRTTLEGLPSITEVFRTSEYDLNKVVTNEVDFLLGAVFSHILNQYAVACYSRGIYPSSTEAAEFNVLLFSNTAQYRDKIKELIGV
jgi:hypothetical protein